MGRREDGEERRWEERRWEERRWEERRWCGEKRGRREKGEVRTEERREGGEKVGGEKMGWRQEKRGGRKQERIEGGEKGRREEERKGGEKKRREEREERKGGIRTLVCISHSASATLSVHMLCNAPGSEYLVRLTAKVLCSVANTTHSTNRIAQHPASFIFHPLADFHVSSLKNPTKTTKS